MNSCNLATNISTATNDGRFIEDVGYVYIIPSICLVGVVFNIVNLVVLRRIKGSSYTYFSALAVADGLALLTLIPLAFTRCGTCMDGEDAHARLVIEIYVVLPVANIFTSWSVWVTVALSIERYYLTKHPTQGRKRDRNILIAKRVIAILSITAILLNLPYFFQSSIECKRKVASQFGKTGYFLVYGWLKAFLVRYIPIVTLATMNILLIKMVRKLDKKRNKSMTYQTSASKRKQIAKSGLTVTLIAIVFVFLIGNIPISLAHPGIYHTIIGKDSLKSMGYKIFRLLANIFEILTFASNFIFYCLFNKKFMSELQKFLSEFCRTSPTTEGNRVSMIRISIPEINAVKSRKNENNDAENEFWWDSKFIAEPTEV